MKGPAITTCRRRGSARRRKAFSRDSALLCRFALASARRRDLDHRRAVSRNAGRDNHFRAEGILAVEMEAAALYAFAAARQRSVACFAHVTNQMGQFDGDFEKGEADGATASLTLFEHTVTALGY